jgi:hypothetical protein
MGRTRIGGRSSRFSSTQTCGSANCTSACGCEAGPAFISWNVATNVTRSKIYEGLTASQLQLTKTISNAGFETQTLISNSTKFVEVGALCGLGNAVFGKSKVASVS